MDCMVLENGRMHFISMKRGRINATGARFWYLEHLEQDFNLTLQCHRADPGSHGFYFRTMLLNCT